MDGYFHLALIMYKCEINYTTEKPPSYIEEATESHYCRHAK